MTILPQLDGNNIIYAIRLTYDLTYEYRYVGQTSRGLQRLRAHISSARNPNSQYYMTWKSCWIRKHFFQITFDVLEILSSSDDLNLAESKWIHILESRGYRLMNHTKGGDGIRGYAHTEETRAKIKKTATGRILSEETRLKMSQSRIGKVPTEETRKKLSISNSGENNAMYGRKYSQAELKAISDRGKGRKHSEETKRKIAESHKGLSYGVGYKQTEETKRKISESKLGPLNPNYGGKSITEETRRKMSENASRNGHLRWHVAKGVVKEGCKHCSLTESD